MCLAYSYWFYSCLEEYSYFWKFLVHLLWIPTFYVG
jgi:hypothetical protein